MKNSNYIRSQVKELRTIGSKRTIVALLLVSSSFTDWENTKLIGKVE